MTATTTAKGYEVEWYDARDLPPEYDEAEREDWAVDWINVHRCRRDEYGTKAEAMRMAHRIVRGRWSFFGCALVRKFADGPDPTWPDETLREYIGEPEEV